MTGPCRGPAFSGEILMKYDFFSGQKELKRRETRGIIEGCEEEEVYEICD